MRKFKFNKTEVKCAFHEWLDLLVPNQSIFAVDFGETQAEREETRETMWRKFVEVLLNVAEEE